MYLLSLFQTLLACDCLLEVARAKILNKVSLTEEYGYSTDSVYIDLSRKNIESIDSAAFFDFKKLEVLHLDMNNLTKIEVGTFNGLLKLRELWLEVNQIVSVPRSMVNGLNNLELLCISDNPISVYNPAQISTLCTTNSKCEIKVSVKCPRKESIFKLQRNKY